MINADRVHGVLVGMAVGDALGAYYEGDAASMIDEVEMRAGGGFDNYRLAGGYSDDTAMAVVIARSAVAHGGLVSMDDIVDGWVQWQWDAGDVGMQTRAVLRNAARRAQAAGRDCVTEVDALAAAGRGGAGNGALMRTGVIALAFLDDLEGCVRAARRVASLTHAADDAVNAAVIWTVTVRHAVLTGEMDINSGLECLGDADRALWSGRLTFTAQTRATDFANNGWTVHALQAAWFAVVHGVDVNQTLVDVVRAGGDTDTVAAIAGALLGAARGADAFRADWVALLHGYGCKDIDAIRALAAGVAGL